MRLDDVRRQPMKRGGEPHDRRGRDETTEIDDIDGDAQTLQAFREWTLPRKHDRERDAVTIEAPREQLEISLAASPVGRAGDVDDPQRRSSPSAHRCRGQVERLRSLDAAGPEADLAATLADGQEVPSFLSLEITELEEAERQASRALALPEKPEEEPDA